MFASGLASPSSGLSSPSDPPKVRSPTSRRDADDETPMIWRSIFRPFAKQHADCSAGILPMTWRRQVSADAEMIKAVAQGALQLLKLRTKASGPPRDPARDAYWIRLCEIYQDFTGKMVSYKHRRRPLAGPGRWAAATGPALSIRPAGRSPHRSGRIGAPSAGSASIGIATGSDGIYSRNVRVAISGLSAELARSRKPGA